MSRPTPLERLRARYDELDARPEETVYFPVAHGLTNLDDKPDPNAVGLVVEYRELDWERNKEVREKWARSSDPRADLYQAAELLISACVNVWVRDDEDGQVLENLAGDSLPGRWTPIGDQPVSLQRAAVLLERADGKDGIQAVFAVLRSDWEVQRHMSFLGAWEPFASPEVDDQFAGESKAETQD